MCRLSYDSRWFVVLLFVENQKVIHFFFIIFTAHLVSGIFRKSGSHELVEQLKKQYNSPTGTIVQKKTIYFIYSNLYFEIAEPDLLSCDDPHCVASLLKQFLASMSEPVIPFKEYDRIITNFSWFILLFVFNTLHVLTRVL